MYQQSTNKFTEKDFNTLVKAFKESICNLSMIEDNSEWDLSKKYLINWACIWNKPNNVGKVCKILQKNNQLSLVVIKDKSLNIDNILEHLYRLEDLSIYND